MARYPEHLKSFPYLGTYRYFLTFCTRHRARHFADHVVVNEAVVQILRTARVEAFEVVAYCFMPDHVHLLIEGTRADSHLKAFVRRLTQRTGHAFAARTGTGLWQRYGYERVLRRDESTAVVARYVIGNPVRAGLVDSVFDYPYWGSGKYTREELAEFIARAS